MQLQTKSNHFFYSTKTVQTSNNTPFETKVISPQPTLVAVLQLAKGSNFGHLAKFTHRVDIFLADFIASDSRCG
jgi:hypothetical protein